MSQYDYGTIDPASTSGTDLANHLNSFRTALNSLHSGSSRPSYAIAKTMWVNDSTSPWVLNVYDGADDIAIGTINPTTNVFTPSGVSSSFADNVFFVTDNADTTKKLAFEVSGVSTGQTRTVTVPNYSGTVLLAPNEGTTGQVYTSNGPGAQGTFSTLPASYVQPTGTIFDYVGSSAPTGYVFLSGRTIGNSSSSATERANSDTESLFVLLWDSMSNTEAPVSGGRGASAAADFAANKTITLPDARGRVIAGKDDMGGSAASRLTSGSSGITGTTLGTSGGSQAHTLSQAEMPSHSHTVPFQTTPADGGVGTSGTVSGTSNTSTAGSSNAHNNTQPTLVLNKIIKL